MNDYSDAGYVPSRSLLRRNSAESGEGRISDGSAPENTESFDAMEYELESGIGMVQEHGKKLSRATEKPTKIVMTEGQKGSDGLVREGMV